MLSFLLIHSINFGFIFQINKLLSSRDNSVYQNTGEKKEKPLFLLFAY